MIISLSQDSRGNVYGSAFNNDNDDAQYDDEIEAYEAAIQTHKNRANSGFSPFNNMTYDEAIGR